MFFQLDLGSSGTFFFVTLDDDTNNEIVKVTVSSGSSGNQNLTVVRAQESTTARAFDSGDKVELRMTAGVVDTFNLSGADISLDASNNRMGFGDTTPEVSLDLGAKTDSLHVPVGTTAQRPGSPEAGYLRYNSTTGKFEGYTDAWGDLADGSDFLVTNTFTTANASTTAFTISNAVQDEKQLLVFIEGVFQAHNSYSVSGTTVTLSTAPASGREVTIYSALSNLQGANMVKATMTGDNSDTTLDLGVTPVSENNVQVYFDGVYQNKDSFSISGQTLTFGVAPPTGVAVEAITHTILDVSAAASSVLLDEFTGDGSDVTFTLSAAPANENNTQVYVGGVYQEKATYSVSGTTLTFSEAPANNVSIEVMSIAVGQINSAIQLSDADGDTKVMVEESADEDKIRFDTAGSERMIIDGSNVGIGASSPNYPLTIHSTGDGIKFEVSDIVDANYRIQVSGSNILTGPSTASNLIFQTGNTEAVRLTTGGALSKTRTSVGTILGHNINWNGSNYSNINTSYGSKFIQMASNAVYFRRTASGSGNQAASYDLTIDSSGKIGVGTTSPNGFLDVQSTSSTAIKILQDSTSAAFTIQQNGSNAFNHVGEFFCPNLTSGEQTLLAVGKAGSTKQSGYIGYNWSSSASNDNFIHLSHWGSDNLFRVYGNGQISSNSIYSDRDKKENIKEVSGTSLDKIIQVPIKSFRMKQIGEFTTEIRPQKTGFIAQEVQPYLPDVVSGTDGQGDMGIDTVGIIAHLVKAIQELSAKVEELEGKIE